MSFRRVCCYLLLAALPLSPLPLDADDLPSWTSIGPDGGDIKALAASPVRPGWILAGLAANGYAIFRSADQGRSWGAASDQRRRIVFDLTIGADGAAFYAATDLGLLRSTDGGASWPLLDAGEGPPFTLVQAHPRRPGLLFAARGNALLRGTDGGAPRQAVAGPEGIQALAFSSGRRVAIYAGANNGLWKSTDAGITWRRLDLGAANAVQTVAVDPRDERIVYAGLIQSHTPLLKSTDGGATWRVSQRGLPILGGAPPPTLSKLAVDAVSPSVVYAVLGQEELFRSLNGGRTWTRAGQPPGLLLNDLEATPFGLLAATTAGVFLSADRGLTWQVRTSGLVATRISGLAFDTQDPPRLYAGDAGAGVFKTAERERPWLRLGDPEDPLAWNRPLLVDPTDPLTVWAGSTDGVAKSANGGRRWTFHRELPCVSVGRILLDPREPSRLFAGGELHTNVCAVSSPTACRFFRSLDAGETWLCVAEARLATPLAIDPFTSAVYALSFDRKLLRSTDGGTSWNVLLDLFPTSFAVSPRIEGTLWAGDFGRVLRSRDGGQSWQSFSTGLPAAYVTALAPHPDEPATLYAGTMEHGVFKSTDGGETWSPAGLWPPGFFFLGPLVFDPADPSILYAGTESLGVLRLDEGEEQQ